MAKRAFTLVELLVVLGVVTVLVALILAGISASRAAGERATAVSQMREIGYAILLYAGDNDNTLPGALEPQQKAVYDPATPAQMATQLGPYLGVSKADEVQTLKVFLPSAFVRAMRGRNPKDIFPFVMNTTIVIEGNVRINPFGSMKPRLDPMKLPNVRSGLWGFTDADQANGLVKGRQWASATPEKQVHLPKRHAWYFDGSVQALDESDIIVPPPPKK